jgi:hypothetical protein
MVGNRSEWTMRHLLLLAALATPVVLYGQEREYTEVPIMAAAVKYMQRFYEEGIGRSSPIPPEYRRTDFRLDAATYLIEPIQTRMIDGRELGIQRVPRKSTTEDPVLVAHLAAAVSLDTVSVEHASKECRPYTVPGPYGATQTYRACRFSQFEGVLGMSLPVMSGDTAKVEVWAWVNYPQQHAPEAILDQLWEITIVRERGVWRAVTHRYANAWIS